MLFNKFKSISYFLTLKKEEIKLIIENLNYKYIFGVNEEEYISYLHDKFLIEEIKLHFENANSVNEGEKIVKTRDFFDRISEVKKPVIKFMIPVSGNYELLTYYPSNYTFSLRLFDDNNVRLQSNCLIFEIISYSDDTVANVNSEYEIFEDYVKSNTEKLNREILAFNENLKLYITNIFKNRRDTLLKRQKSFANLKVPLIQNSNISETFSISFSKSKNRIEIPKIIEGIKHKLDPLLDYKIYEEILKIINDCGKEFERLKKTYQNFKEEDFRNNILFVINSHYEGTATGETFNNQGKTDILLRYDNSIIFIAECKI